MKKSLFLVLFSLIAFTSLQAQFKMGIRGGISTMDVNPGELIVTNSDAAKSLGISVRDADYGMHFGLFMQAKAGNFFIQPEVLFNSNTVNYSIRDFRVDETVEFIKKERFQNLDIPIMMGAKYGPLRIGAGPVAHVRLNNASELLDIEGYSETFDGTTWGYQAGIGLDLWKIILDVKYQGNFSKFGDHMNFFGQDVNFNDSPGSVVASIGIAF